MKSRQIKSPKQTIRAYCQHCLGLNQFNAEAIKDCQGDQAYSGPCPFFPFRLGKRSPVKVFRAFCLACMGGSHSMVKECETTDCLIHPYRFGKNPARTGKGSSPEVMARIRAQRHTLSQEIFVQNEFTMTKRI